MAHLKLMGSLAAAVIGTLFSCCMADERAQIIIDKTEAIIQGPVNPRFFRQFKKVIWLSALPGSTAEIFCQPLIMKSLKSVLLKSTDVNEQLNCLAKNYAQLENLALESKTPLDRRNQQNLSNFSRLRVFQIRCQNTQQSILDTVATENLKILVLDLISLVEKPNKDYPQLEQLRLDSCKVTKTFTGRLKSPKLREIYMSNCLVAQGAITALQSVVSVKQLYMYRCRYDTDDLNEFRRLRPDVKVVLPAHRTKPLQEKNGADKLINEDF